MKTSVVYVRVSSREQAEGFSIDAQIKACNGKADIEGYNVLKVFRDEGFTATNTNRPALKEMLDFCKDHDVNVVIVHKLDRFARSVVDHSAIRAVLMRHNTNLVSCTEQLGDAPHEIFLENIMASMAQYYSDNLKTEVKKGITGRFEAGYHMSNPPYGYEVRSGSKIMQIIPEKEKVIQKAFDLFNTRAYSYGQIVGILYEEYDFKTSTGRKPVRAKVQTMLQNIAYAGMSEYKKINKKVKGLHEPIVTMETFQLTQEIIAERGNVKKCGKNKYEFIYKKLIRCTHCEDTLLAGYSTSHTGKKYLYYFCRNPQHKAVNILEKNLHKAVNNTLPKIKMSSDIMDVINLSLQVDLEKNHELSKKQIKVRERLVNDIVIKREQLLDRLERGILSEESFVKRDKKLDNQLVLAKLKVNETQIDIYDLLTQIRMIANFGSQIDRYWEIATFEQRQKIITGMFLNPPRYKSLNLFDYELSPLYQAISSIGKTSVSYGRRLYLLNLVLHLS